jgi:N-acylglucosamine-6-phosphate 2-epimerase
MARFARCAVMGGAAGIRASGAPDVAAIAKAVSVPIIGIWKERWTDGRVLITPHFEQARELVAAGAAIIALDCSARGRQNGALERLRRIRTELGVPVMADVATLEEARVAAEHGADIVAPTLRGYTDDTRDVRRFSAAFVREMVRAGHSRR